MPQKFTTGGFLNTVDSRMVAIMRMVLAFSALLITYVDPSEPNRFVFETYLALILYSLYSTIIYVLVTRESVFIQTFLKFSNWADVLWCLFLIALSSGTSSIFFFFFFFVILYTSFSQGFRAGLRVTLVSAVAFTLIGYATALPEPYFELNRFLLRPIYLNVLGYMMAYWGGYEILSKRRLALLREISIISNPRFGVDRTLGFVLELLRDFFRADGCLLVMTEAENDKFIFRRAEKNNPDAAFEPYQLNTYLLQKFLSLPKDHAVIFDPQTTKLFGKKSQFFSLDLRKKETSLENGHTSEELAEMLDAASFLTIPIYFRKKVIGRLFVVSSRPDRFDKSDIDFLLQAVNQFMPVIENMRLIDHLASNAAEEERKRIARDIHDSVIQQYIGLQYGLISLEQILDSEPANERGFSRDKSRLVSARVKKLKQLTDSAIENLRDYTRGLKEAGKPESSLLPSIKRFAEKFTSATGIAVVIRCDGKLQITDRLTAELFQLIVEGLSNIRKHTQSPTANISLEARDGRIFLTIENESDSSEFTDFTPVSISERVQALGGFLEISQKAQKTSLSLEIPL